MNEQYNKRYAEFEYEPLTDDEYIRIRKTDAVEFVRAMYGTDERFTGALSYDGYQTQTSDVDRLCTERPAWFVAWLDVQQLRYNQKIKADVLKLKAEEKKDKDIPKFALRPGMSDVAFIRELYDDEVFLALLESDGYTVAMENLDDLCANPPQHIADWAKRCKERLEQAVSNNWEYVQEEMKKIKADDEAA